MSIPKCSVSGFQIRWEVAVVKIQDFRALEQWSRVEDLGLRVSTEG